MTNFQVPLALIETFEQLWKTMILNYEIILTYQKKRVEDEVDKTQSAADELLDQCKFHLDDYAEKWEKAEKEFKEKEERANLALHRLMNDKVHICCCILMHIESSRGSPRT